MELFSSAFGEFKLQRQPVVKNEPLRAWDAADELILDALSEPGQPGDDASILILNDQFAALTCALNRFRVDLYSDSFLCQLALQHNLALNQLQQAGRFIPSTDTPQPGYDVIVIKMPKTMALLEHQLATVKAIASADATIIAGGMVKYLEKNHFALFERYLGPVSTSLAKKKARLLFVEQLSDQHYPSPYPSSFNVPELGIELSNHANLFSRTRLDQGTRLYLQHLSQLPRATSAIDMGCGNGVMGLALKRSLPELETLLFVDESFMALASSRDNYLRMVGSLQGAGFVASNGFHQLESPPVDLVVCNPPFHQANTIGDYIAWDMFKQSRQFLNPQGRLVVVGNRHLNYHQKIKRLYGNIELLGSNSKFVLLAATKT